MATLSVDEFLRWVERIYGGKMFEECRLMCNGLVEPPNGSWYNILRYAQNKLDAQKIGEGNQKEIKFNTNF
jgi:hypothetical protein